MCDRRRVVRGEGWGWGFWKEMVPDGSDGSFGLLAPGKGFGNPKGANNDKSLLSVDEYWQDAAANFARIRTLYQSQNVTVAAMQIAEKKVWAHRS